MIAEKRAHYKGSGAEQSGAKLTLLPPPARGGENVSPEHVRQTAVRLDHIAGASFDEVASLLRSLTGTEIGVLANQLKTLPPGSLSSQKIQMFFAGWAKLDPSSAFATSLESANSWVKEQALRAVFEGMNPAAAATMVRSLSDLSDTAIPRNLRQQLLGEGITKWSLVDPQAAAEALSTVGREASSTTWIKVADNWAATNPQAALEWTATQQGEPARLTLQGILSGWFQKDPSSAAEYARGHSDLLAGQQAASVLASRMVSQSPGAAAEWASTLPNADARSMAELTVGVSWAQRDPQSAVQWAANLPANERNDALAAVVSTWAQNDPQAAAAWLNSVNPANRDAAVAAYSSAVRTIDPAAALSWAGSV